MSRTKERKWIAKELATQDPDGDYERIWKLSTMYYADRFQTSFFFAYVFPLFQMTPRQGQTVYREGKGLMITNPI